MRFLSGNTLIPILILSPTPALRAGLRALLSGDPDLSVETAAGLGDSAGRLAAPRPLANGEPTIGTDASTNASAHAAVIVATQGALDLGSAALLPEQALLLVTGDAREAQALAGLELRAWGILSPDANAEALQVAVRALAVGLVVASPEILRQALPPASTGMGEEGVPDALDIPLDPLTERENEVLLRLAQGLTNKQIALALGISEHTVKFHVSSIYTKLGVSNRTEAVRKGARRGWIPL